VSWGGKKTKPKEKEGETKPREKIKNDYPSSHIGGGKSLTKKKLERKKEEPLMKKKKGLPNPDMRKKKKKGETSQHKGRKRVTRLIKGKEKEGFLEEEKRVP